MKINSQNLNISLRHIRALHEISQAGSFAAAASKLGIVPSALSEIVRQLEESAGAPLFDRNRRPPELTPLGRGFLDDTAHLLEGFDSALTRLRQAAGAVSGSISIGASPSAISEFLAPVLTRFLNDRPEVKVAIHDDIAERLAKMVKEGALDLAIAGNAIISDDLITQPLAHDPIGLACHVDHPLAQSDDVVLSRIDPRQLIGLGPDTGTYQILKRSEMLPSSLLEPRITVHSTIAQLALIREGVGLAFMPQNAVSLFADPRLRFRPIRDLPLQRDLYIVLPARRLLSPAAKEFLANMECHFEKRL